MHTMLSQAVGGTTKKFTWNSCTRCSGHMAHEMCIDLESDSGHSTFWALRCIQCGDMVDEVILRNRCLFNPEPVLVAAA